MLDSGDLYDIGFFSYETILLRLADEVLLLIRVYLIWDADASVHVPIPIPICEIDMTQFSQESVGILVNQYAYTGNLSDS